ncbi:MAG: hypothetical protein KDE14_13780 [Rhodobacteraceae bacterium]|nr:hypothetical protein [Paracoccaceae bacterium]
MISSREFASSLYGLWLLLKLDRTGFTCFERTVGGFWRSYVAAVVVAPFNFLHAGLSYEPAEGGLGFGPYMIVEFLSYVLSWTAYPLAMIYISRLLAREARLLDYLVPYNWFQLAVAALVFPVMLLFDAGILSPEGMAFLQLLSLGIFVSYAAFLARVALDVVLSTAFALVLFDFMINLLVSQVIARI